MARGSKAIGAAEGHRTKAEIKQREQAEADMLSGKKIVERDSVKESATAHAEFRRVVALLKAVGKDDALYTAVVNRYCELYDEVLWNKQEIARLKELSHKLEEKFDECDPDGDTIMKFTRTFSAMIDKVNKIDGIIMQKRKMMLDIEKENGMTVQAALRSIPKDTGKKDESPLLKLLKEE